MKPWSFSSLGLYETCPWRYFLVKVSEEVKEPHTEATLWGSQVHEALEFYVKDGTPLPENMKQYQRMVDKIVGAEGSKFTELEIALDRNFQPVEWTSDKAWVRGIIDVGVERGDHVIAMDYKTGRRKKDSDQLMLFSALLFHSMPHIQRTTTGFLWLKENCIDKDTFTRDDITKIWNRFLPRVNRLEDAFESGVWQKRTSGLCKAWCPVGKKLCIHCGRA